VGIGRNNLNGMKLEIAGITGANSDQQAATNPHLTACRRVSRDSFHPLAAEPGNLAGKEAKGTQINGDYGTPVRPAKRRSTRIDYAW
jgi:hypothetical protein